MNSPFPSPRPSVRLRRSPLPSAALPSSSGRFPQSRFLPTSSLFPRRSRRRSHLRKPNTTPIIKLFPSSQPSPPQRDIEISIDLDAAIDRASASVTRLYRTSESRLRRYLSEGVDAFRDLGSSVHIDGRRLVFSCRPSSLVFIGGALVWAFIAAVTIRAVLWAFDSVQERRSWWVVRRDRSLGGREVVVGKGMKGRRLETGQSFTMQNPLSPTTVQVPKKGKTVRVGRLYKEENLPDWWPVGSVTSTVMVPSTEKEEYQRRANMLVREIMDRRVSGKDYSEDDIIQLRKMCRFSGAKVSFDTDYARNSYYRASVDLILNLCDRAPEFQKNIHIDGEGVYSFLAGLSDNVGLKNEHAIVILRGAIAAKTHACFLQAWALEVQGKKSDVVKEISKIVNILKVFPLEDDLPELEMVANGLKRNLKIGQREYLLDVLQRLGGDEIQRFGKAALGLVDHGH